VAVGGSYAAVAHPLAILAVVVAFLGLFALLARRVYRRLRRDPASP
jgi:nitrate reductase gamma subunit